MDSDDDEGLYDGFEVSTLEHPAVAPPSAYVGGGRPMTGARPMTSNYAAGYSSNFDPLNDQRQVVSHIPDLLDREDNSVEFEIRSREQQVHQLLEASSQARRDYDVNLAVEKAREAVRANDALSAFRERNSLLDQTNQDLDFGVHFALATHLQAAGIDREALSVYSALTNQRYSLTDVSKVRVNMGNIYFSMGKFVEAISMYRRGVDSINNEHRHTRTKIMTNIGSSWIRLGQFSEAITTFESIEDGFRDEKVVFNLLMCFYAIGETNKMRRAFGELLGLLSRALSADESKSGEAGTAAHDMDKLGRFIHRKVDDIEHKVVTAAQLIAPKLIAGECYKDIFDGYDAVIEIVERSKSKNLEQVSNSIKVAKAIEFLKRNKVKKAIEVLKDPSMGDSELVATNLSFVYFFEGNQEQSQLFAEKAIKQNRYNAKALVNLGNCAVKRGDLEQAQEIYLEAIGVDTDCMEAIYNFALVQRHLENHQEALQAFQKLERLAPNSPEVIFQIANTYEILGDLKAASQWYTILTSLVPHDPSVLLRLGEIHRKDGEDTQACHHYLESYQVHPVDLDTISWLGVWFVKSEMYDRALKFFERAAQLDPQETKWSLMVASCHRRMGKFKEAFEVYKQVHVDNPEDIDCLKHIITLCQQCQYLDERDMYKEKLEKLEEKLELAGEYEPNSPEPLSHDGASPRNNFHQSSAPQLEEPNGESPEKEDIDFDDEDLDDLLPI